MARRPTGRISPRRLAELFPSVPFGTIASDIYVNPGKRRLTFTVEEYCRMGTLEFAELKKRFHRVKREENPEAV